MTANRVPDTPKQGRGLSAAAGDTRQTYILCPRPPAELALSEIGDPPLRQAA